MLLILLTTLLGFIAILSSWTAIKDRVKEYYAFMLLLQVGMLGVFMSLDFLVFYVFWEVMLVPMYFLIGVWGGPRKLYAAIKFFLYTLVGSVLMLVGILAIYFYQHNATGIYSFDILAFQKLGFPTELQLWVFIAFFIGFAIKVPMFPFHTWLPDAHVEAPTAGSVILAGVLLKMGTYGFYKTIGDSLPHRDYLWRACRLDAEGYEIAGRLQLGQPSWFRNAGGVCRHSCSAAGRSSADDKPWDINRRALPDCGNRL
jgi:NADH-quinone oxidoreductase subunit M